LDRRLSGPQTLSGAGVEEEKVPSLPLPGIESPKRSPQLSHYTDLAIRGSEEMRTAYKILDRKPGRPRRKWEDDFKIDLNEIGCEDEKWIHLAQDCVQWRAVVYMVMNLRVP
jgi:hypothetical protein